MRRIHTILTIIYGVIWMSSFIFVWMHWNYIDHKSLAGLLLIISFCSTFVYRILWYLLRKIKKDNVALKSWYSVIVPAVYSIIIGVIIEYKYMNSGLYNNNLGFAPIVYSAAMVFFLTAFLSQWHASVVGKYRDALKQNSERGADK
ncbi:MAG: hypothetical protein ACYC0V_19105 [Armatimonadota bacterium]